MVYLDNAATTKVNREVLKSIMPYITEYYGNPSAIYGLAQQSDDAIYRARRQIAEVINAELDEIYFTSGGTESDNWALKGAFEEYSKKGNHIITTKIEHHAILHTCEYLEKKRGARITYLDVDENGLVDIEDLKAAITPETILISIMFANNEIGTIEPIKEIGAIAKEYNIPFHTDAVQAFGQIPIDVKEMNIGMLSSSAHKINGVKGVGFLYIKNCYDIPPLIHGGGQESGKRAGTENVPGIVGYGVAAERANETMNERKNNEILIREYIIERLLNEIPNTKLNGHERKRLPNNINISFDGVNGESLLALLDVKNICASSGSVCTSASGTPSHVLKAIGLTDSEAKGSLRLTLSSDITLPDADYVVKKIKEIVSFLRSTNI